MAKFGNSKKKPPVSIVDNESPTFRILARVWRISTAERWIERRRNKAKILRGGYGIDAPETMVNKKFRKIIKK